MSFSSPSRRNDLVGLEPRAVVVVRLSGAGEVWKNDPQAMQEAVGRLEARIAASLEEHRGERVDVAEAEIAARFAGLVEAVEWALDLREIERDQRWPESLGVVVGVSVGVLRTRVLALSGALQLCGEPIVEAARLAAEAPAGALAISAAGVDVLEGGESERAAEIAARLQERGALALVASAEATEHAEGPRGNLPEFDGAFVGRTDELDALAAALRADRRLIALCGHAGAGKSRLAVEFAHHWRAGFIDPGAQAWLCDLSEVSSAAEALFVVARATGVQIPSSDDVAELEKRLMSAFAERGPVLLVLDDVDRLGEAFEASVARWLEGADQLVVLVTRQQQPPERAGLAVVTLDTLGRASAAALLADRLAHPPASSSVMDEPDRLRALVERCGRLPLALELVARRVDRLLDEDDAFSAPGPSGELERALLRSWQFLTELEQQALAVCTVFAESFAAPAAVGVIEATLQGADAAALLATLRKSSLVRADARPDRRGRLVVLTPVAQFVQDRADPAVLDAARAEHLGYYAGWAAELQTGLCGADELPWLARGRAELPNLHRAADFGVDAHVARCVAVVEGLAELDTRVGPLGGFNERADAVVRAARDAGTPELLERAVFVRARVRVWTGQYAAAEPDYREAAELADERGDQTRASYARSGLGLAMVMCGKDGEAAPLVVEAAEQALGDTSFEAIAVLTNAAIVLRHRDEFDRATDYLHRALVVARRRENAFGQASGLFMLGTTLRFERRFEEAARCLEEAVELFGRVGDRRGLLVGLQELGACYTELGELERSEECYREAMALAADIGDREYSAVFWYARGRSRFGRGEFARAESDLLEASIAVAEIDHVHLKVLTLLYLGATYGALGRATEARAYFERADAVLEQTEIGLARAFYRVLHGYFDAARAREAARRGDEAAARDLLVEAYARGEVAGGADASVPQPVLHEATRLRAHLDVLVERGDLPADAAAGRAILRVSRDLRWFAVEDADPVDISRRGPIRRILRALVDHRLAAPGEPLSAHDVVEAGWPDAVLKPESGAQRTYVTISRMRSLGLKDVVETIDDGYLINPAYTPVWVERE